MSTICKLDPNVRLDRRLRRSQVRQLSDDATTIRHLISRGENELKVQQIISKNPDSTKDMRKLLFDLRARLVVTSMTYKHIRDICISPFRTGARKEAILERLGAQA